MSRITSRALARRGDREVLAAFMNGIRVGTIYQTNVGKLLFCYDDKWRADPDAYPLSLSMPLFMTEHRHEAISPFLWGLLPDNERTLDHYARVFGVSSGNPVSLLSHIGADCAGAIQFASPEAAAELQGAATTRRSIEWLDADEIARELRTAREQGVPGTTRRTIGQFSLAGAQPKIALLEENGRWGRPNGRIPTNRILKPPSGEFRGFAENEHFCLEIVRLLGVGSVVSRIERFANEVTIVVERFDRTKRGSSYQRIHQEDICQALAVMPNRKYESEGGPGVTEIVSLLREVSLKPVEDIERFLRVIALSWIIAATDAHAKNYALLHGPGGAVRLAPFYDVLSYLPYADRALHRVKLSMKIGTKYAVAQIGRRSWEALGKATGLNTQYVLENIAHVLEQLPAAIETVAQTCIDEDLDPSVIRDLADRIGRHTNACAAALSHTSPAEEAPLG